MTTAQRVILNRPVAIRSIGKLPEWNSDMRERKAVNIRKSNNNWSQDQATKKSSYKEHRVDAMAPYADEGRGKLRKAAGNCKQVMIRRYPNGGTRSE